MPISATEILKKAEKTSTPLQFHDDEQEIKIMRNVGRQLSTLSHASRGRVVAWLAAKNAQEAAQNAPEGPF